MIDKTNNGWNYRVVVEREPDLVTKGATVDSFSFRDVYYKDGVPTSCGADPQSPVGEDLTGLMLDLSMMLRALEKNPILLQDGELKGDLPYSEINKLIALEWLGDFEGVKIRNSIENIKKAWSALDDSKKYEF